MYVHMPARVCVCLSCVFICHVCHVGNAQVPVPGHSPRTLSLASGHSFAQHGGRSPRNPLKILNGR